MNHQRLFALALGGIALLALLLGVAVLPKPVQQPAALLQSIGGVRELAFSPDGTLLADATEFQRVTLYNTRTGAVQHVLPGSADWVRFSPHGSHLLVSGIQIAGKQSDTSLWNVATGQRLFAFSWPGMVEAVSPDLSLIVVRDPSTVTVYQTATGKVLHRWPTGGVYGNSCFSPDGSRLAVLGVGPLHGLLMADTQTWKPLPGWNSQGSGAMSVQFSADGRLLLSTAYRGALTVWDAQTGLRVGQLQHPLDDQFWPRFTGDSRMVMMTGYVQKPPSGWRGLLLRLFHPALAQPHMETTLWNYRQRGPRVTLAGCNLLAAQWHGGLVATDDQSGDSRIQIRHDVSGQSIAEMVLTDQRGDNAEATMMGTGYKAAFSRDGRMFAAGGSISGIIKIWRLGGGK